jgi:hypothetical protein
MISLYFISHWEARPPPESEDESPKVPEFISQAAISDQPEAQHDEAFDSPTTLSLQLYNFSCIAALFLDRTDVTGSIEYCSRIKFLLTL